MNPNRTNIYLVMFSECRDRAGHPKTQATQADAIVAVHAGCLIDGIDVAAAKDCSRCPSAWRQARRGGVATAASLAACTTARRSSDMGNVRSFGRPRDNGLLVGPHVVQASPASISIFLKYEDNKLMVYMFLLFHELMC